MWSRWPPTFCPSLSLFMSFFLPYPVVTWPGCWWISLLDPCITDAEIMRACYINVIDLMFFGRHNGVPLSRWVRFTFWLFNIAPLLREFVADFFFSSKPAQTLTISGWSSVERSGLIYFECTSELLSASSHTLAFTTLLLTSTLCAPQAIRSAEIHQLPQEICWIIEATQFQRIML